MYGRDKDDITFDGVDDADFDASADDEFSDPSYLLWNGDEDLFILAHDAFYERGDDDCVRITQSQYNELDSCGLTYKGLLGHMKNLNKELYQHTFDMLDNISDEDDYDSALESASEMVSGERRSIAKRINANSSVNSPMLVAAGVLFGLPDDYIETTSMVDFFTFYCNINRDVAYPHFDQRVVMGAFAEREKWVPMFPYLQAGFTDVELIQHALDNDIDVELLRVVD